MKVGNLVGNSDGLPGAGQPAFPPFPHPPKGGGKGNGEPREIPTEVGSGKSQVGNHGFRLVDFGSAESYERVFGSGANLEEIAELLQTAANIVRAGGALDSAAWRVADAAGLLARKVIARGMEGVPGVHERTGRGCAIYPPEADRAFGSIPVGGVKPTALYRHFDADGVLLYVGISLNAVQRLAQHRTGAKWFGKIARVDVEWLQSRDDALAAEAEAIRTEHPLHNIAGSAACPLCQAQHTLSQCKRWRQS